MILFKCALDSHFSQMWTLKFTECFNYLLRAMCLVNDGILIRAFAVPWCIPWTQRREAGTKEAMRFAKDGRTRELAGIQVGTLGLRWYLGSITHLPISAFP